MSILQPSHHLIVPHQSVLTNSFVTNLDEPALRRRARHDPPSPVHRRKKRFARNRRINSFDDHGIIAHASANKTFLSWKRRGRALAYDPILLAVVLLAPREVVMIVHFFD